MEPMEEQTIHVDFSIEGDITVATITQSSMLDATNSTRFGTQVIDYLKSHEGIQLIVNFEHVNYMSSAGLTELLRINEALQAWGTTVRLWGLNCDIHNVFCITHLDKLFVILKADSLDQAINQCSPNTGSGH